MFCAIGNLEQMTVGGRVIRQREEHFKRYERELERIKEHYPDALYPGIADGATDNGRLLNKHTEKHLLDFQQATQNPAKAACRSTPQIIKNLSASDGSKIVTIS